MPRTWVKGMYLPQRVEVEVVSSNFFLGCYIVYLAMSTLNLWLILPGHVLWGGSLHGGYGWPKDVETLKCWKLDSCHLAHWEKSIEEVEDCGSVFIFFKLQALCQGHSAFPRLCFMVRSVHYLSNAASGPAAPCQLGIVPGGWEATQMEMQAAVAI